MIILQSGSSKLVFHLMGKKGKTSDGSSITGYGIYLKTKGHDGFVKSYEQKKPIMLLLFGNGDFFESEYKSVVKVGDTAYAKGTITTPNGSVLDFEDTYSVYDQTGTYKMSRKVSVVKAYQEDLGFSTCYSIQPVTQNPISDYDMFAPGVWYKKNENVVMGALASNLEENYFYIREMRLSLPIFMMKNTKSGDILSISHIDAIPSSNVNEASGEWLIDESIQYGSLGVRKTPQLSLDFIYPGSEGEKNYVNRNQTWVRRSHPLRTGINHEYNLIFKTENKMNDYATAMTGTWQYFYRIYNPQIVNVDVRKLYNNGVDLLDVYCQDYNGVTGLPFKATLVEGEITGNAMVMGFVGQQLPAAYQMLRYGLAHSCQKMIEKASAMVEFWATRSMMECGLPRTWYEPYFEQIGVFTNSNVDTRTMSDGMEGAIDAWNIMKKYGIEKPDWLDFCKKYADWLTVNQNPDGSYYRLYDLQGNMAHEGKFNTTNPIRFLTKMFLLTKDEKYRKAAIKAGEFSYENIYRKFMYVGGTSDNDNTIDKEGGVMAMNAFLSLYDMTKDKKWLEAFKGAADYTETWTFAWDYTVRANSSHSPYPDCGMIGQSLVSTGHSYTDMYMAYCSASYYRLYLFTGDEHYVHFAKILQNNTNSTADINGKLGYKYFGIVEEGAGVDTFIHNGVGVWLTWCTVAELEPLSVLEDRFGSISIDDIEKLPLEERMAKNDMN